MCCYAFKNCETHINTAWWSQHGPFFPPPTVDMQPSLEQPLVAYQKNEHTHTHTHTLACMHALPGLPHQFLPVRVSSLLPESGPHTEPTCFAMQRFYTGTKCQRAKSICAPLFLLSWLKGRGMKRKMEKCVEKKASVVKVKGQKERERERERRGRWRRGKKREGKLFVRKREEVSQHDWDSCIFHELLASMSVTGHYSPPTVSLLAFFPQVTVEWAAMFFTLWLVTYDYLCLCL